MKKRIINWGILSTAKIGWEHVIPAIKKSKNRKLKAKIRRSKSIPEVNIYAMLIMKEELDIEGE